MAGGVSVGAIFARLGMDTSEFQAGLGRAARDLQTIEPPAKRAGVAVGTSLGTQGFAVAAFTAQQLTASLGKMTGELQSALGPSGELLGATMQMSTGIATTVAQGTKLTMTLKDFTKLSPDAVASMAMMGAGALELGTALGTIAVEVFPKLGHAVVSSGKEPFLEFADALASNEALYQQTVEQAQRMAAALKLSGSAYEVSTERSRENAVHLAVTIDRLTSYGRAQTTAARDAAVHTAAMDAQGKAAAQMMIGLSGANKELRDTYGVLSKRDMEEQMAKLVKDFTNFSKEGVSAQQLLEKFNPKVAELQDVAKGYTDVNLPKGFKDLAAALSGEGGGVDAVRALEDHLKTQLPTAVDSGTEDSKQALAQMSQDLQGSISGGFGRGAAEGTNFARQQLDAFITESEGKRIPIKFELDKADIQRQWQDAVEGLIPNTGGRV